jgi:hypothetical protein
MNDAVFRPQLLKQLIASLVHHFSEIGRASSLFAVVSMTFFLAVSLQNTIDHLNLKRPGGTTLLSVAGTNRTS